MNDIELTKQEQLAIELLKKVARHWPDSLWIFASPDGLNVMRTNEIGQHALTDKGGVDPAYVVETIQIDSDGGDW